MAGRPHKETAAGATVTKLHQLERARRWQTERMRALADRIEAKGFEEASQVDIDAIFDRADAEYGASSG